MTDHIVTYCFQTFIPSTFQIWKELPCMPRYSVPFSDLLFNCFGFLSLHVFTQWERLIARVPGTKSERQIRWWTEHELTLVRNSIPVLSPHWHTWLHLTLIHRDCYYIYHFYYMTKLHKTWTYNTRVHTLSLIKMWCFSGTIITFQYKKNK
jgi:hypothetical protein